MRPSTYSLGLALALAVATGFSLPATAAASTSPTAPSNLSAITQHLVRGGAANISGTSCAEVCQDYLGRERSVDTSTSGGQGLVREMFALRATGMTSAAPSLDVLPGPRQLSDIDLSASDRQYRWLIGSGTRARLVTFTVPGAGATPPGVTTFRLEWHQGGPIYSPPAPQDLPEGFYVFANGRGWVYRTDQPANSCAIAPPTGPYTRYSWSDTSYNCDGFIPQGGWTYFHLGTPEFGNGLTYNGAVADYSSGSYDLQTFSSEWYGWPSTMSAAETRVTDALDSGYYPKLREWYAYLLGDAGACDPTAPGTCNAAASTVPDCANLTFTDCSTALYAAGFQAVARVDSADSAIDYSKDPDAVLSTAPVAGTVITTSRTIKVTTNPSDPRYSDVLAARFRPRLRFDNSEKWRPLDLPSFFGENQHRLCSSPTMCSTITTVEALSAVPSGYLDVAGSGDGSDYKSPYSECNQNGLRECDTGSRNGLYFRRVGAAAGYHYLDYWAFYRFNDAPYSVNAFTELRHEGDWEGATIGVAGANSQTFDFASLSQHGKYYSYLRNNLGCDGGQPGTCGTEIAKTGKRLSVYVADKSHANYPRPCSAVKAPNPLLVAADAQLNCRQTGQGGIPESGGYDGTKPWGSNDDSSVLRPFPVSPAYAWQYWGGKWGAENAPDSPGKQEHWDNVGESCLEASECASGSAASTATGSTLGPTSCRDWFGEFVGVVACRPSELAGAIRSGRLTDPGSTLKLTGVTRAIAAPTGTGITQMMGPLQPGETVTVSAPEGESATVLVRGVDGHVAAERTVAVPGGSRVRLRLHGTGHRLGVEVSDQAPR